MKKALLATLSITALLAVAAVLPANDPVESLQTRVESLRTKVAAAEAGPADAVVRLPSHGGSGTAIATGDGWTLICYGKQ